MTVAFLIFCFVVAGGLAALAYALDRSRKVWPGRDEMGAKQADRFLDNW